MKLVRIEIEGYRSIRETLLMHVEQNVTVVLGPNDHGKTNLLQALTHLNVENGFSTDDLNWDSTNRDDLPRVIGVFDLTRSEMDRFVVMCWDAHCERDAAKAGQEMQPKDAASAKKGAQAEEEEEEEPEVEDGVGEEEEKGAFFESIDKRVPSRISIGRSGLDSEIECPVLAEIDPDATGLFLNECLPRIELVEPWAKLSDSAKYSDFAALENEFMRGIFYYAGLKPGESKALFNQTDQTQKQLKKASTTLNDTLKKSWSQGEGLSFQLSHNSSEETIELLIEDPAITDRYVRASRRSSGFTHYFSMKTILHARQQEHPAASYVWLFDEPGIYLHPTGQYDLLQVLETLGKHSQIVYSTHSLFMINKTFPTRHRLLLKGPNGTYLEGKPYSGRWGSVLSSLGLSLTGTILFANQVVLVEGDADPILLQGVFQRLIGLGRMSLDLNAVSFVATGESRNTDVLVRLLCETQPRPSISVLVDGDAGGKARIEDNKALLEHENIPWRILIENTTVEDYLPLLREIYVPAVARYVHKLISDRGETPPDPGALTSEFTKSFEKQFSADSRVTAGVADWAAEAAKSAAKLKSKPSKVGIAREYINALFDAPDASITKTETKRAIALAEWLHSTGKVPALKEAKATIVQDED